MYFNRLAALLQTTTVVSIILPYGVILDLKAAATGSHVCRLACMRELAVCKDTSYHPQHIAAGLVWHGRPSSVTARCPVPYHHTSTYTGRCNAATV